MAKIGTDVLDVWSGWKKRKVVKVDTDVLDV